MAKLTKEQVLALARLSKLHLSDEEVEQYQRELSAILDYVEQLESIDVKGLQPTLQVGGLTNQPRDDEEATYQADPSSLRQLPPSSHDNYIKVGRMIG